MRCTFHIKAVATIFDSELDTWFQGILENIMETRQLERDEVFQLKVGHETEYDSFERLITFNYEVSPFSVVYTNARENFLQFIISLFANWRCFHFCSNNRCSNPQRKQTSSKVSN